MTQSNLAGAQDGQQPPLEERPDAGEGVGPIEADSTGALDPSRDVLDGIFGDVDQDYARELAGDQERAEMEEREMKQHGEKFKTIGEQIKEKRFHSERAFEDIEQEFPLNAAFS